MNKTLSKVIINAIFIGTAMIGIHVNDRALDIYQFGMWFVCIAAFIGLFLPSKDLFKENNSDFLGWIFCSIKVSICVWVGMSILAAFYLIVSILCYGKKKSHFNEVES